MDKIAQTIQEFIDAAMGISAVDLVVNLVATIILILVVKYFFWNKVTDFIEKRKEIVEKELTDARKAKEEAEVAKLETEEELKNIRSKANEMIENARLQGNKEASEIVNDAKERAKVIIEDSKKEANLEMENARKNIHNEIVAVATEMASRIIEEKIDQDKYNENSLNNINEETK